MLAKPKRTGPNEFTVDYEATPDHNAGLAGYVDRLEQLETEKRELAEDIKEVLEEAEKNGHHKQALRQVIKIRLMNNKQRAALLNAEEERDLMLSALGMLRDTPLGDAAVSRLEA